VSHHERLYAKRRKRLLKMIDEGIMLIPAAMHQMRSNDTEYPFRQNSNFYYLSGFEEDNALLLLQRSKKGMKQILFVQKKDRTKALWSGKRLGVGGAKKRFHIDKVYAIEQLDTVLVKLLKGVQNIYIDLYGNREFFHRIHTLCRTLYEDRHVKVSPHGFLHVNLLIEQMRLIKSKDEIAVIEQALEITKEAHETAMKMAKKGMFEYELQALIEQIFTTRGAQSEAYSTIVASGNNANTLHYIANNCRLRQGDLILIDAGCEYAMYASDITRTFPVSGTFSPAQKALYNMVLEVQLAVIDAIAPGVRRSKLQRLCETKLCEGLIALGIIKGRLKTALKHGAHKKYFPHGVGHWMGIDVHDQAPYVDAQGRELALEPGMVLTVEPGIYIDQYDTGVPERYRGIGIRIEDDIVVTRTGCRNLSQHIAKRVEEIEALCVGVAPAG